jgi:hypothetical protein
MTRSIATLTPSAALACLALVYASAAGAQEPPPTLAHAAGSGPYPESPPPPTTYLPGDHTLNLVLYPGGADSPGTGLCQNALGDRVCGVFVEIEALGDVTFPSNGFTDHTSAQTSSKVSPDGKWLRLAMVTTASPLDDDASRLGTLAFHGGNGGGSVKFRKVQIVDASLDLRGGNEEGTIAVIPEPGFGSGLAAGALALAQLARLRARRGGVR